MSATLLSAEKWRIFTMRLSDEEIEQISLCRKGILVAVTLGSAFGLFCGRMAAGPGKANFLVKGAVLGSKRYSKAIFLLKSF